MYHLFQFFEYFFSASADDSSLISAGFGIFFFSFLTGFSSCGPCPFCIGLLSSVGFGDIALFVSLFRRGSFLLFLLDMSPSSARLLLAALNVSCDALNRTPENCV